LAGRIAGYYVAADAVHHGFVGRADHLRTLDVPGSASTEAYGVNDHGQIVGSYTDLDGHRHGFLDTSGQFTTFDISGATSTTLEGINNLGEIVGSYSGATGQTHGFLAADIVASAAGRPDVLRDLLPGWVENKAAQRAAHGASWNEQHPSGPAMAGAVLTQDVSSPYAVVHS
jgi:probable HAF family extracellular repeat protein